MNAPAPTWSKPVLTFMDLSEARGRSCEGQHWGGIRPVSYRSQRTDLTTGKVRTSFLCRQHAAELAAKHQVPIPEAS